MSEFQHLLDVARDAATRGAALIRGVERPDPEAWQLKGQSDFVTRVDRDTEALIGETLTAAYPESLIQGEELHPDRCHGSLVWIVDPLDGTTNFLHSYPAYGVSIAAVVDGVLAVGVVVDVAREILYHAVRGAGAWCGARRLAVSATRNPANALIGTGFPFKVPHLLPAYLRHFSTVLMRTSGIRRAGAACLDFADLAQGRFDGFWELHLSAWDVAGGALLVREAGGVITDLDGGEEIVRQGAFVAGNPTIHEWLMGVLRE